MPVYNVERFVRKAIESILAQTERNWELLIVNDCSTDNSASICREYQDERITLIDHPTNKGLAAARNTGIRNAKADVVALIDSDDFWHPSKLEKHLHHLAERSEIGVSYSHSAFVSESDEPLGYFQTPQLDDISPEKIFCRNPVSNGSNPVIRKATLNDILFKDQDGHDCYFDESFRQSEDIECWLRIATTTNWVFAGIPHVLTYYRLNAGGLSAGLSKQYENWERVHDKIQTLAPDLIRTYGHQARAYQLRFLARQGIRLKDGKIAVHYIHKALKESGSILREEPGRTISTFAAAWLLRILPRGMYFRMEAFARRVMGNRQKRTAKLPSPDSNE